MSRLMLINQDVRAAIQAAIDRATKKIVPREVLERSNIAPPDGSTIPYEERIRHEADFKEWGGKTVEIPFGYSACFTIENQPPGLTRHISVSIDGEPGACPSKPAMNAIAEAFGFILDDDSNLCVFLEEYEPGRYAVNYAQLITAPTTEKKQ